MYCHVRGCTLKPSCRLSITKAIITVLSSDHRSRLFNHSFLTQYWALVLGRMEQKRARCRRSKYSRKHYLRIIIVKHSPIKHGPACHRTTARPDTPGSVAAVRESELERSRTNALSSSPARFNTIPVCIIHAEYARLEEHFPPQVSLVIIPTTHMIVLLCSCCAPPLDTLDPLLQISDFLLWHVDRPSNHRLLSRTTPISDPN